MAESVRSSLRTESPFRFSSFSRAFGSSRSSIGIAGGRWKSSGRILAIGELIVAAALVFVPASPAPAQSCQEWRLRSTTGPSPRGEYGLAYDSRRGMTVMVGGARNLGFDDVVRETWEWNGQSWALVSTGGPTQRCDNAVGYDGAREVLVSFGGYDGTYLRDTWTWNGSVWEQKSTTGPLARADSFMAFRPADGGMILLGGKTMLQVRADTWRWNGTTWTALTPATSPPARWIHRMAYDAAHDEIVVFGGASASQVLGDMWSWTGSTWTQRTPVTLPPARYGNAIAYDSHRQVVLLFGGQNGFNFGVGVLGDTWEWNGTNWSALPVSGPSARTFMKMAYDQRRRKIVLFGGYNGTAFVNDTWELGSDLDIAAEPAGLTILPGAHAEFHVTASGTGPFSYQWLKDGFPVSDGGRVSGSTTNALVIDPVQAGDAGEYSVVIGNACGPVNSRGAMLVVLPVPGEASRGSVPGQQMRATYNRATGAVGVTYTPACSASDHTIHYGPLTAVGTYGYTGGACHVGVSGSASFTPGAGSFFFLIVGNDGNVEGSYGFNSNNVARPADPGAAPCALPQNLGSACD